MLERKLTSISKRNHWCKISRYNTNSHSHIYDVLLVPSMCSLIHEELMYHTLRNSFAKKNLPVMLAIPPLPKYHFMYHTLMYSSSSLEGLSVFTILSSVCLNQLRIDRIPSPNNHFKSICILFKSALYVSSSMIL